MSGWLGGWFGGGNAAKKSQASKEAILGLRTQLDMLQKREAHTEKQILEQENIARKHVSTNKTSTLISRSPTSFFTWTNIFSLQELHRREIEFTSEYGPLVH